MKFYLLTIVTFLTFCIFVQASEKAKINGKIWIDTDYYQSEMSYTHHNDKNQYTHLNQEAKSTLDVSYKFNGFLKALVGFKLTSTFDFGTEDIYLQIGSENLNFQIGRFYKMPLYNLGEGYNLEDEDIFLAIGSASATTMFSSESQTGYLKDIYQGSYAQGHYDGVREIGDMAINYSPSPMVTAQLGLQIGETNNNWAGFGPKTANRLAARPVINIEPIKGLNFRAGYEYAKETLQDRKIELGSDDDYSKWKNITNGYAATIFYISDLFDISLNYAKGKIKESTSNDKIKKWAQSTYSIATACKFKGNALNFIYRFADANNNDWENDEGPNNYDGQFSWDSNNVESKQTQMLIGYSKILNDSIKLSIALTQTKGEEKIKLASDTGTSGNTGKVKNTGARVRLKYTF